MTIFSTTLGRNAIAQPSMSTISSIAAARLTRIDVQRPATRES